jgi:hypothetical protein
VTDASARIDQVGAHPEHGEPVDYQMDQLLPQWLSDALESGEATLRPNATYRKLIMLGEA